MKNSSYKNNEYTRFQIPNNFVISPKGKETKEISVISPKICPICGSKDIFEKLKLESTDYKKFITIFMCEDHYKPYLSSNFKFACYPFFYVIAILILAFILYELTSTLLIFGLGGIIAVAVFGYKLYKRAISKDLLQKSIELRHSKKESIISIKRPDWANEFQKLNKFDDYSFDVDLAKYFENKWKQTTYKFMKFLVITIAVMGISFIISLILQLILLKTLFMIIFYLSMFTSIIGVIIYGSKIVYYSLKEEQIKSSEKENYARKNCIIALIIVITVPTAFWIVGSLIEFFLIK